MRRQIRRAAWAWVLPMGVLVPIQAQDPSPRPAPAAEGASWTTAVEPKPIGPAAKKGLDWLVEHQLADGGWGQGDEAPRMGTVGSPLRDKANVADTAIAALALIRSGSTPKAGPYQAAVDRAVRYVRGQVEASDPKALAVSTVQGTRVQAKLGPNIDTFLAALLLAEANGRMADRAGNEAVAVALNRVLAKIKGHQKADGTWDNKTGWAPILAQSMAGKGINRASQAGAVVEAELLAKTEGAAQAQFAQAKATILASAAPAAPAAGAAGPEASATRPAVAVASTGGRTAKPMAGGAGSAGVELYDRASSLSVLQDSVNTNATKAAALKAICETSKDPAKVAEARDTLKRFEVATLACADAKQAVVARLDDKGFVAGFGSNGGEEFLSYMNIAESLVLQGGAEWKKWDDAMTANLGRVQNDDGSWTGHHCITGRTFCTSTALLVLLADRTPVPTQAKGKAGAETAAK